MSDFPHVDPTMFPFACDTHFFYFIAENPNDVSDPIVFSVDHEDTTEKPRGRSTVGHLLAVLEVDVA